MKLFKKNYESKNILFYGDSNTWGFDPSTGLRYPYEERWTTVCADLLGKGYNCIPAGMNGRTTVFDDPLKGCRNGIKGLDYELQTNKPLDLFVLMLGTNDLKYTDAEGSAHGIEKIVSNVLSANERFNLSSPVFPKGARILLISPVHCHTDISETGEHDARAESIKLSGNWKEIAEKYRLDFLDAAKITEPSSVDGVHLSPEGHQKLGHAAARKITSLL
ncbi:MAG: SGNH/GDSL hydrolase family protein [Parasporobacterium sp.]|nr:SGNH/GDSL hydrolase family protein [Parasporobacterium sp.]